MKTTGQAFKSVKGPESCSSATASFFDAVWNDRAVASIDEEVVRLLSDGLTAKELDESRRYLIGSIPRALETNAAIATFLQQAEFFGLGFDYDIRLPGLLGAVTVDEANAAARRVLDDRRATVVIAGPYQE